MGQDLSYVWVVRADKRNTLCTDGKFHNHNKPEGVTIQTIESIERPSYNLIATYLDTTVYNHWNLSIIKVNEYDWLNPRNNKIHHGILKRLNPQVKELIEL